MATDLTCLSYDDLVHLSLFGHNWYEALSELLVRNGKTMDDLRQAASTDDRPKISRDLRADIWDKTGGRCVYCQIQTNPFRDFSVSYLLERIKCPF